MHESMERSTMSTGRKKIVKNSVMLFVDSVARMGSALVVSIYLAREYGPEGLGLISTALSLVTIAMGFSVLGLSGVVIKELIERPNIRGQILFTVTCAKFLAGSILFSGLLVALVFLSDSPGLIPIVVIIGWGYLFISLDTFESLYNANNEFTILVFLRIVGLFVSTAIKLVAIYQSLGLQYVAVGYALDFCLMYLLPTVHYFFRRVGGYRDGIDSFSFDAKELFRLLRVSWPVLVSGGFAQINLKIDVVLIAFLGSVSQVGIYSAASRLSEAWSIVAMALVTAIFPGLVRASREDSKAYSRMLSMMFGSLIWISLAGAITISLTSAFIVDLIYGPSFAEAAAVLSIHVFGGVFLFIRTALSRWLIVEGLLIFSLVSHVSGAAINVIANFILVPRFGVTGAAWATVLSYSVSALLFLLLSSRTRPMFAIIVLSAFPFGFAKRWTAVFVPRLESQKSVDEAHP